jgi:hypothetical protein
VDEARRCIAISHFGRNLLLVRNEQRTSKRRVLPERLVDRLSSAQSESRKRAGRRLSRLRVSERERRSRSSSRYKGRAGDDEPKSRAVSSTRGRADKDGDQTGEYRNPGKARKTGEKTGRISEIRRSDEWQL